MESSSEAIQKRLKKATRRNYKEEFQVEMPKESKPMKFKKPPVGAVQRRLNRRRR